MHDYSIESIFSKFVCNFVSCLSGIKRKERKNMFKRMIQEFKEFAMRGNVVDMAVGIIIGAAFGGIVQSLVNDVIMPPIGLLLGNVDFTNLFVVLKAGSTAGPCAPGSDTPPARRVGDSCRTYRPRSWRTCDAPPAARGSSRSWPPESAAVTV